MNTVYSILQNNASLASPLLQHITIYSRRTKNAFIGVKGSTKQKFGVSQSSSPSYEKDS